MVQATLTPAAELVQEFARTWGKQEPLEGKDAGEHVARLTGEIVKAVAFNKLMVAMLQNTIVAGAYALHAELGLSSASPTSKSPSLLHQSEG